MNWLPTFATPALAAIAAAIAVPSLVILYFLKLRRKSVEVSSTLLWKKTIQDLQANAPFQKLRRNILLLLQLLMLAAALLALAQPQSTQATGSARRHVILIDRSASMNAIDGDHDGVLGAPGITRLEAAKRRALREIDALTEASPWALGAPGGGGDEAMVIAFDAASADIVQTFTPDKAALRAAVERVAPSDVPGAIGEAFRLAQAHRARRIIQDDAGGTAESTSIEVEGLVGGPPQTFHLFTDGRLPDLDQFLPAPDDTVYYHRLGRPNAANTAITGIRAERAYDEPDRLTIFVGLQNASPTPRSLDVELLLDGTPSAIRPVTLPAAQSPNALTPDQSTDPQAQAPAQAPAQNPDQPPARPSVGGMVFELTRPQGAIATVRLRTGDQDRRALDPAADALPTDDEAYLVVPPARRTTVAVVSNGNFFLAEALSGLPLARLERYTHSEFLALDQAQRDAFDVLVLDGLLPPGPPPGRALPPGRFLIFNAVPTGPDGLIETGSGGFTPIIDWQRDHPALRALTLDAVRVSNIRTVAPAPDASAQIIAETAAGPAIVELTSPDSRALVLPFDIADSTWPWNVSFVVFLAAAIDDLALESPQGGPDRGPSHPPIGSIYADRLPSGAASVYITPPPGGNEPVQIAPDGRVVYGPIRRAGVYQVEWTGPTGPTDVADGPRARRFFAASLSDPAESDIAPAPSAALANQIVSASAAARASAIQSFWPHLILAALALLMLEWYIFNRKVYL